MASEWKQSKYNLNSWTMIEGTVRVTVQRGDFGRWYWFMYDGDDPVNSDGNFTDQASAMDAAETAFDSYR